MRSFGNTSSKDSSDGERSDFDTSGVSDFGSNSSSKGKQNKKKKAGGKSTQRQKAQSYDSRSQSRPRFTSNASSSRSTQRSGARQATDTYDDLADALNPSYTEYIDNLPGGDSPRMDV
jgi:hypothetical protein